MGIEGLLMLLSSCIDSRFACISFRSKKITLVRMNEIQAISSAFMLALLSNKRETIFHKDLCVAYVAEAYQKAPFLDELAQLHLPGDFVHSRLRQLHTVLKLVCHSIVYHRLHKIN